MDNSRSAHASPLNALLRGVPGGHVRLAVGDKGVVIAQLNRDHGHPHSLQLPAAPAVALVLTPHRWLMARPHGRVDHRNLGLCCPLLPESV